MDITLLPICLSIHYNWNAECFNPCFNGYYTSTPPDTTPITVLMPGFNPCFNGYYTSTYI